MSYIQLSEGLKKNVGKIQLNVPKNEKAKDLFATLPYLANLKDPILQNKVEDLLKIGKIYKNISWRQKI